MSKKQKKVAIGIDLESAYKHHTDVAAGILEFAREAGWECQFEPFIGPEILGFKNRAYDGVIGRVTRQAAKFIRKIKIPAINVWNGSPDRTVPRVVSDQVEAGKLAGTHLTERGFRRFAFIGYRQDFNSELQLEGMRGAIKEKGCTCPAYYIARNPTDPAAWAALQNNLNKWVKAWKKPIGVFTTQDTVCRYIANVCKQLELRIPDDVGLVGCSNQELICESLSPSLTSIEHAHKQHGYEAARQLQKLMDGEPPPAGPVKIKPLALIERGSTDVYAVDDPILAKALRFISENSARPIGVIDVAANIHVSRRSLERRFKKFCGYSIYDGIVRSRIRRFKKLLVEKDDPIKSLAIDAGFSSGEYLSKVFRRYEGVPPGFFRKDRDNS